MTPETAITVTSCKLTLMVDDGNVPTLVLDTAPTASGGANDMVHVTGDDAGFYDLELAAANVNYVGRAMLSITDAATHCPVFHEFMILPAKVYDSLFLGTDNLEVDTIQWLGTACSTPTTAGVPNVNAKTWNDLATVALPLVPTTAGRTLDVSAGGEAGVDWANVGSPTTSLALTGTTIAVTQKVDLETVKTQTLTAAAGITFGVYVGGTGASALEATAQSILTDTAEIGAAGAGLTGLAAIVWNAATATYGTAGSYGEALEAVGAGADPWLTNLPGAYGPGTAGHTIGTYITGNTYTRLGAPVGASISADIAGVQADTDNIQTRLPAALVSGRIDASVGAMAANTLTASALAADAVTEIQSGLTGETLQVTTIATLTSQTVFTLTAGSADDNAYNGCRIVIQDASTAAQKAVGFVLDYTGSTKTITLRSDPAIFTMAVGDTVTLLADQTQPTARIEAERLFGINQWPVYGSGNLFALEGDDNGMAAWPSIMHDGTNWCLYYSALSAGGAGIIRRRTSADGKTSWSSGTTVLSPSGSQANIWSPTVWKEGATWHMIYGASNSGYTEPHTNYATSSDGLTWTNYASNPIMSADQSWEHSTCEPTGIIKIGSTYYLWYCSSGYTEGVIANTYVGDRRANYATSTNLTTWTKHTGPIFGDSDVPSYAHSGGHQFSACPFKYGNNYYLIVFVQGANTDYQHMELWESHEPTFDKLYRRRVGVIHTPKEAGIYPDSEMDICCVATDSVTRSAYTLTSSEFRVYVGVKHSGTWATALLTKPSALEAFRWTPSIAWQLMEELQTIQHNQLLTEAAAENAQDFFDGTGYAGTGNVIPTVTTLTNLPAITSNWLTAAGLAADAVTEIQAGLALAADLATLTAYVDTEIAAIKAKTDNLPASPAAVGSAMTLTSGERDAIAAALLDLAAGIETGVTPRQALRAIAAICAGIVSGAGTGTEVFKAIGAASGGTTRATVTVDSSGNRSAVVLP